MPKCPDCKGEMKLLAVSYFCPNDCDRPEGKARNEAKRKAEVAAKVAEDQVKALEQFRGWFGYHPGAVNWATIKKAPRSKGFSYVSCVVR